MNQKGGMYSRFHLILPIHSTLTRESPSKLVLETPHLRISIEHSFSGCTYNLPRGFSEHFLAKDPFFDIHPLKLSFKFLVSFKRKKLLTSTKWDYYTWIDSLLANYEERLSSDFFFNKIQWEAIYTLLQCHKTTYKNKNVSSPININRVTPTEGTSDAI